MINELWVLLADMSNLTSPASKLSISVDTLIEFKYVVMDLGAGWAHKAFGSLFVKSRNLLS